MHYKILLVDDDSDDRAFFTDAVERISDEVSCTTLSNGHALLPALTEGGKPDIIFLDLNMPGISGWDCLSLLKEDDVYKDIPVVMYSTSKHEEEIARAKKSGALCFLSKPADFTLLVNAIDIVVQHLQNGTINVLPENSKIFC